MVNCLPARALSLPLSLTLYLMLGSICASCHLYHTGGAACGVAQNILAIRTADLQFTIKRLGAQASFRLPPAMWLGQEHCTLSRYSMRILLRSGYRQSCMHICIDVITRTKQSAHNAPVTLQAYRV